MTLALYMLGLTISTAGFTASIAYAIWWGEQPAIETVAPAGPVEIVVDGETIDTTVAWYGADQSYDVYEVVPIGDGRRRLAVRDDPRSGRERPVVRVSVPRRLAVHT